MAEFAELNGLAVAETYQDLISGKTITREGLERLKADSGRYRAVVVSSVDRLSRDMGGSFRLLSELLELGLEVYSADMGLVDLTQDMSVMHFGLRSMFAHLDHSGIKRKLKMARHAMAERGLSPSGTKAYGLRSARGSVFAHPDEAGVVRRAYRMKAEGMTLDAICRAFNAEGITARGGGKWHAATLSKVLRNPLYKGESQWQGRRLIVPALVDAALWEAGQPPRRGRFSSKGWLLTGHLRCGRCGHRMRAHTTLSGSGYPSDRYRCDGKRDGASPRGCGAVLNRKRLEGRVTQALSSLFDDDELLRALLSSNYQGDAELTAGLAALDAEDAEAFAAKLERVIGFGELGQIRADIERRRKALFERFGPRSFPLETFRAETRTLSPRETLEVFGIVATATRDTLSLGLE